MECGLQSGLESGFVFGVGMAAFTFGIVYNIVVGALEKNGRAKGFTALLVMGGVSVTLALAGLLIGLEAFLVTVGVFVLTGLPMIVGAAWRYTEERRREEERSREVLQEMLTGERRIGDVLDEIRAMKRQITMGEGNDGT